MKKKQTNDSLNKKTKNNNYEFEYNRGIKQPLNFPNIDNSTRKNVFSHDDSFLTKHRNAGQYSYTPSDMIWHAGLPKELNTINFLDLKEDKFCQIKTTRFPIFKPIVVKVKRDKENMILRHKYSFPSLPLSTKYMPRCTTAFSPSHFGHFKNNRFREYKQLKNIFDSHNLNKYKYVVDPIFYTNDDTLRKEFDDYYDSYIHYLRNKRK